MSANLFDDNKFSLSTCLPARNDTAWGRSPALTAADSRLRIGSPPPYIPVNIL